MSGPLVREAAARLGGSQRIGAFSKAASSLVFPAYALFYRFPPPLAFECL